MTKTIYMDYAAATPMKPAVFEAMKPFFSEKFYNPSALYTGARDVKAVLESARASVGQNIGARPSEIIFTAGGSESANLAIQGVMDNFDSDAELIVSAVEHDAVLKPALKYNAKIAPVDSKGRVDVAKLVDMITDSTVLISVMYANNEVGAVQPIKELAEKVNEIRRNRRKSGINTPLYLHTDAAQAPLYLDINIARLGVDLMTLNGGKIYGPKQSGILFIKAGVKVSPQIIGGGQEFGLRSGTENVANCIGFAKALEICAPKHKENAKTVAKLSEYFITKLEKDFNVTLNGHRKFRLPNNIHVTIPDTDNERVIFYLDQAGVFAATGSACSASSDEASHVLLAMGLNETEARSSIRFTIAKETTFEDIEEVLRILKEAVLA